MSFNYYRVNTVNFKFSLKVEFPKILCAHPPNPCRQNILSLSHTHTTVQYFSQWYRHSQNASIITLCTSIAGQNQDDKNREQRYMRISIVLEMELSRPMIESNLIHSLRRRRSEVVGEMGCLWVCANHKNGCVFDGWTHLADDLFFCF